MKIHKNIIAAILLCSIGVLQQTNALAWGREGHTVVVQLALRLMDSTEREKVFALLGTRDPSEIGNWADEHGKQGDTARWHYVDIPASDARYKAADCGDACVVSQLEWAKDYVRNHRHSEANRRIALLWWFHLASDIHQPFHCYDNNDGGGNKRDLKYNDRVTSLHKFWDSGIFDAMHSNTDILAGTIYVQHSERPFPSEPFVKTANRSHKRAVEAADVPDHIITKEYIDREWPIVLQSLWEAACMAAEIGPDM